ncbi:MAG: serine hydrolase [Pseudomonadota bacterium]
MARIFKWLGLGVLAIVVLAAAVGLWKREEIARLLAVNSLFEADKIVANFSNMDAAFLHVPVPRGDGPVSPLEAGEPMQMPEGFVPWLEARSVTSLVVLKDGKVVYENYFKATNPEDLRISWSVAKSFLSALTGVIIAEGTLPGVDVQVTDYVPSLKGTAYDGATLQDVLQMESGVVFNEDYFDYDSDINRMGRTVALGGALDDFTAELKETFADPGDQMKYTSIDTHVVGMVLRGATGKPIADLLSEKIIQPLGFEAEPFYVTDGEAVAFVLGGLNMTTRDYARFGQMILQNGKYGDKQVVPADWIAESTVPSAKTKDGNMKYGYQWWMPKDAQPGEVLGQGVYGQYLWIDRVHGVVIATNGADRGFRGEGVSDGNVAMMRAISRAAK